MKFEFEVYANGKFKAVVEVANAEMAYRCVACCFLPSTPVTIVNKQTGESRTFTRKLDNAGNVLEIIQHIQH